MRNNNKTMRTRSRKVGKGKSRNGNKIVILSEAGRFAPDKLICTLVYQDPTGTRSAPSGTDAMNWGYRSSAFDPDPAVLSGAIPGFAELATLYSQYCVHKISAQLELCNQELNSVIAVTWPSNSLQNTNSLTAADLAEYSGNVKATSRSLGPAAGMNRVSINTTASGTQLVGDRFKTDLDYSGSTSGNPTEMFFVNVGLYSPLGNFQYPIMTRNRLFYTIEFFRLRQLDS